MFSRRERLLFAAAGILITAGFMLMAIDPAENGFGLLTLWIAPILLLAGFVVPLAGIAGADLVGAVGGRWKQQPYRHGTGVLIFLTTFIAYICTLEPTASLWDCSEFIPSAYKLQVPHTPGTPLALLIGRLFTMLSFGDVTRVAWSVNLMSAFFSALAVVMAYYIIRHAGSCMRPPAGKYREAVMTLSAAAGSFSLAFSDTFWFSAVEAETYGPACFFLLLLLWLILKGRDLPEPLQRRMLMLIFYLAGLAYCIHPMCLLALPVLPFSWYTRDKNLTLKNSVLCLAGGLAIVLVINRFVAIGVFQAAFSLDRFLVNELRLPFYSGAVALLLISVLLFRTVITRIRRLRVYAFAAVFLLAGLLPYLLLFVRSNHNPPIDEFNPEDLALIKAYMNREGYPGSPLLYGPYFDARIRGVGIDKKIYFKGDERYEVAGSLPSYQYDARQTFLPRLYSNDPDHVEAYRRWTGLQPGAKPTFADNLRFLFTYQLGHMYLRYLMWNFAGRQSDAQNSGWLKPWERLSLSAFENARNQYFMIPLAMGILGAAAQFRRDRKGFVTLACFFLFTGVVLALYLNSPPVEPRERDYIYVGSYTAFSIWIGLACLGLGNHIAKRKWGVALVSVCLASPLWMFLQNIDDHNRSGRTFQVDHARNILRGCAPNAILFTGGDNDTFPLWYVQEVEGFRTDVRVMVLSYMNTDWYINQLRKTYYDSPAFKLSLDDDDYRQYGPNDVLYLEETIKGEIDVKQYLALLKARHPALTRLSGTGEPYHILPSRTLKLTSLRPDTPRAADRTPDSSRPRDLVLTVTGSYVSKNLLAIVDLIISNEWKRPIYFNFSSMNSLGTDFSPYLTQEGTLYRLTREEQPGENIAVDTELTYKHLVEMADYSNLADTGVHFSYEDHYARIIVPVRQSFNSLALAFLDEGNVAMAAKVMREATAKLYHRHLRPSYTNLQAAEILQAIHEDAMADALSRQALDYYSERVEAQLRDGESPDPLDAYLLRQSRAMLREHEDQDQD